MTTTARYVFLSQINFLIFLFVCLLLSPHYLFESNEGGISNFGVHSLTIVPYSLAFGLASYYSFKATYSLVGHPKRVRIFRISLRLLSTLYLLTLLSTYPYKLNGVFDLFHQAIGIIFVIYVLIFGGFLVTKIRFDPINCLAYLIQLSSFVLAVINFFDLVHLLFVSEALTSIGFGIVLVRSTDSITAILNTKKSSRHSG